MFKNFFTISLLAFSLFGCENNSPIGKKSNHLNPVDQPEKESDQLITAKIRKLLVEDTEFSQQAKNIKIITLNGKVTLIGFVNSDREKNVIDDKVHNIPGINNVDNQLEVKKSTIFK